jgi:hypothetical protein
MSGLGVATFLARIQPAPASQTQRQARIQGRPEQEIVDRSQQRLGMRSSMLDDLARDACLDTTPHSETPRTKDSAAWTSRSLHQESWALWESRAIEGGKWDLVDAKLQHDDVKHDECGRGEGVAVQPFVADAHRLGDAVSQDIIQHASDLFHNRKLRATHQALSSVTVASQAMPFGPQRPTGLSKPALVGGFGLVRSQIFEVGSHTRNLVPN